MELLNEEEFVKFIKVNYKCVFKGESSYQSEIAAQCDFCKRDSYLKIKVKWHSGGVYLEDYLPDFATLFIQCPSCERKSFLQAVVLSQPWFVSSRTNNNQNVSKNGVNEKGLVRETRTKAMPVNRRPLISFY